MNGMLFTFLAAHPTHGIGGDGMRGYRRLPRLFPSFLAMSWAILCAWLCLPESCGATLGRWHHAERPSDSETHATAQSVWTVGDRGEHIWVLHVVLAELGYLPFTYHCVTPTDRLYAQDWSHAPLGAWTWNSPDLPPVLRRTWDPNQFTEITKGAIMRFESDHGLRVDGYAGPRVRRMLQLAMALHLRTAQPYRLVMVDQTVPQRLCVWEDGRGVVFQTLCSTGLPSAPTQPGLHVIFLRNREQTMQGVGPSGRPYRVEHVPYVSFFYGEQAIHGFPRTVYGGPQSAGCVELPIAAAERVWQLTGYGTLVFVSQHKANGTG